MIEDYETTAEAELSIALDDERAENTLLRSILRKLADEGDVELRDYGPRRPERAGDRFLGLDYSAVDLTRDEAALFDAIANEKDHPDAS